MPYTALRWRGPSVLIAPMAVLLPGALVGSAAALSPAGPAGGAAAGGYLAFVLATTLLLCRKAPLTTPVLLATALSVAHGTLFLLAGGLIATPALASGLAVPTLPTAQPIPPGVAGYLAYALAFLVITPAAALAVTVVRYAALTKRPA